MPRRIAGNASKIKSTCHPLKPTKPCKPNSKADNGEPIKLDKGMATINTATIRAIYRLGNHSVKYSNTPGKNPASAAPSKNREIAYEIGPVMKAVQQPTMPQVIMILAIQIRAPSFSMAILLGISNMTYAIKNNVAPKPKAVAVKPIS
ncbi:Uncharacterised protein [Acinetobacter baumannii]|nr:Uncharacterised protein [Acinetobacter baumannii]